MEYTIAQLQNQLRTAQSVLHNCQTKEGSINHYKNRIVSKQGKEGFMHHVERVQFDIKYMQNKISNLMLQINGK
jgi:hypothetical protein